ncbi:MAG: SH3-like domain-containing protein [Saprospiraceae bacterium]|nr:SH3-like domain-containing protein [Saprospiraceae bacterium]
MYHKKIVIPFVFSLFLLACDSKPKIIVADETPITASATQENAVMPQSAIGNATTPSADVHQVVANEVMQTERYTYLNVSEAGKSFWIATAKTDATKGQTYLYRGGLMKTKFESVEFKRTFDTIYLVSNIISATEHPGGNLNGGAVSPSGGQPAVSSGVLPVVKDAVKLSELMANKTKYEGKVITVTGECVKVNNGIMGKNWVHIQDGSKEKGKALDLTVTTNLNIPVGSKVALNGKITLNKDFGAGYKYEIIMEDAAGK